MRLGEWFGGYRQWNERRNAAAQARAEKRRASAEKTVLKSQTVSTVDNLKSVSNKTVPTANENPVSVGGKLSSIFKKINDSVKPETTENRAETATESDEAENTAPPMFSVPEDFAKADEAESLVPIFAKREDETITFTPVEPTGELDAAILETVEDEAEAVHPLAQTPQKPQNFEDYILPRADFLNPPPPRVQIKEEEALASAKELEEKTKEFNATGTSRSHLSRSGRDDLRIQTRSGRQIFAHHGSGGRFMSRFQSRINPH